MTMAPMRKRMALQVGRPINAVETHLVPIKAKLKVKATPRAREEVRSRGKLHMSWGTRRQLNHQDIPELAMKHINVEVSPWKWRLHTSSNEASRHFQQASNWHAGHRGYPIVSEGMILIREKGAAGKERSAGLLFPRRSRFCSRESTRRS